MVHLSIYELEETVSIMVKSSQDTIPSPKKLVKPSWWPIDHQFPLKRHPSMDKRNWREILHNLIAKCYQNCKRLRNKPVREKTKRRAMKVQTKRRILETNGDSNSRMRRDSTGSSVDSTVSSFSGGVVPSEKEATVSQTNGNETTTGTVLCSGLVRENSGGDATASNSEISVAEALAKNLGLSQIKPVVQVYDVCKVNPSYIQFDNNNFKYRRNENCDVKRDIHVEKSNFMNYFGLKTDSNSNSSCSNGSMLPNNDPTMNTTKLHTNKHNLVNCPHVPFSSNVGLKLIKDWHNYDSDVIEKRLERLERYLCNNDLPSLLTPIKEDFKVLHNSKNSETHARYAHFYIFPTKKRHRKTKLTPKARFLLNEYCKPCFVNLSASGDDIIKKYLNARKQKLIAIIDLTKKDDKQKENKTPFNLLESRVVLTAVDKFKKKLTSSSSSSSSLSEKVNRTNFALQTLSPRNENLNSMLPPAKLVNFINPSVVLQPIHELFEFTKRDKISHTAHKITRPPYKVVKNRVNVYNPRRFSTRLQEVINV